MAEMVSKGLDGLVVDSSTISEVTSESSKLIYRGYRVDELAERCRFEEVAMLLWYGELPTRQQLHEFSDRARPLRGLDQKLKAAMDLFPRDAHPMDVMRTAVSRIGMKPGTLEYTPEQDDEARVELLAKIPTIIARWFRLRHGRPTIEPRHDLGFCENFLYMCFGELPHPTIVRAFEASMVLYAEHSFNASTYAARVITSTNSDIYSAVVGAIGALKGPLHGGANEEVMYMLKEIGTKEHAKAWVEDALAKKKKIMGFGHRVYKKQDSRAPTMQKYGLEVAQAKGDMHWHDIARIVEETMIARKNIYPNLDYPAGPLYFLIGFDIDLFTPLFVMARIVGWTAHVAEQKKNNRLIRPLCEYTGPAERRVFPIEQR